MPLTVTTSWDDGHPEDERLAALLAKYGIGGTFYVPSRNSEGRPVMSAAAIRSLATTFEIGGHTEDHVTLPELSSDVARHQITSNKAYLEEVTGERIRGFCYPRGKYTVAVRELVARSGFDYARTIRNFSAAIGDDIYLMPVTLQFFPHTKLTYAKNFIRHADRAARFRLFAAALSAGSLVERIRRTVDLCAISSGVFHLWGHSWELQEHSLWNDLETVLQYLAGAQAEHVTNGSLIPVKQPV